MTPIMKRYGNKNVRVVYGEYAEKVGVVIDYDEWSGKVLVRIDGSIAHVPLTGVRIIT